jgi:hypothetical protein
MRSGKKPEEIARQVGISLPSYYDLEDCDDLYNAISLGNIVAISRYLDVQPRVLFTGAEESNKARRISQWDLAERIKAYLRQEAMSQAAFEAKVGWELGGFLDQPDVISNWNVDCLRDICRELGLDWLQALPD